MNIYMYAISTLLRCSKRSAMQKKTNKQTYNSKTDQSNASINKWDLRLVLKVSNLWPNLECVVLLWILQECIETNYYIKDLGNNAVCERAEARSRLFLVIFYFYFFKLNSKSNFQSKLTAAFNKNRILKCLDSVLGLLACLIICEHERAKSKIKKVLICKSQFNKSHFSGKLHFSG